MKYLKIALQLLLGFALTSAGISHLTTARAEFQAQVPDWLPLDADFVVIASGVVEIGLGLSLLLLWRYRGLVGLATALFFVDRCICPASQAKQIAGQH